MAQITLHVKNTAHSKEELEDLRTDPAVLSGDVTLDVESPPRKPTASKAPLGESVQLLQFLIAYFDAPALIVLGISGVVTGTASFFTGKLLTHISNLIAANNRKKGNAWGAKLGVEHVLENGSTQHAHFFLDGISAEDIPTALTKAYGKDTQIRATFSTEYLNTVKNIGYTFDSELKEWKLIGVEKFDGTAEEL